MNASHSRGNAAGAPAAKPKADSSREKELLDAIESQPAEVANYLELADMFTSQNRLREVTEILTRALAASGGGDLMIRERLEDAHLRRHSIRLRLPSVGPSKTRLRNPPNWRSGWRRKQIRRSWKCTRPVRAAIRAIRCCSTNLDCGANGRANSRRRFRRFKRPETIRGTRPWCSSIWASRSSGSGSSSWRSPATRRPSRRPIRWSRTRKKLALYRAGVLAAELNDRDYPVVLLLKADQHADIPPQLPRHDRCLDHRLGDLDRAAEHSAVAKTPDCASRSRRAGVGRLDERTCLVKQTRREAR